MSEVFNGTMRSGISFKRRRKKEERRETELTFFKNERGKKKDENSHRIMV
jgi:hypothetical protein